jgi:hypothetical protein
LNVLDAPYFGCLSVCLSRCQLFVLFVTMVNFGDDYCFINRFKPAEKDMDESLHHGKWRSCFETKRKHPFFWHITDNFALKNATTSFPKLKKHSPTNLYMLYPMVPTHCHGATPEEPLKSVLLIQPIATWIIKPPKPCGNHRPVINGLRNCHLPHH